MHNLQLSKTKCYSWLIGFVKSTLFWNSEDCVNTFKNEWILERSQENISKKVGGAKNENTPSEKILTNYETAINPKPHEARLHIIKRPVVHYLNDFKLVFSFYCQYQSSQFGTSGFKTRKKGYRNIEMCKESPACIGYLYI